jgi:hypothetical protein
MFAFPQRLNLLALVVEWFHLEFVGVRSKAC